jgi:hypothetical protein
MKIQPGDWIVDDLADAAGDQMEAGAAPVWVIG